MVGELWWWKGWLGGVGMGVMGGGGGRVAGHVQGCGLAWGGSEEWCVWWGAWVWGCVGEGGRGREGGEYMGVWVGRLHIYIYVWTCGSLPQPPILLSFDLMDHIPFRWQSPTPLPTPPNPTM